MKRKIQPGNGSAGFLFFLQTVLIFFLPGPAARGQVWEPLGPDDSNWPYTGGINYLSSAISNQGLPYVIYMDRGVGDKASCRKFQGGKWVDVGQRGFSEGTVRFTSITIKDNGIPFVVYQENNQKATVKKFISGNWVNVGEPGFTETYALNTSIVVDDNGTPYVVYIDGFGPMDGAVSVKKFTTGQWTTVGLRQFSAGRAEAPSMAIDKNGTPYVVYQDWTANYKTVVKKFTGSSWMEVGNIDHFSYKETKIAINSNGVPFIAYQDETAGLIRVKKFSMGSWKDFGSATLPAAASGTVHLAFNNNGIPYVSYVSLLPESNYVKKFVADNWVEVGMPGEAGTLIGFDDQHIPYVFSETVRKLTNGQWKDLGTRYGFAAGSTANIAAATDGNGIPYMAFQDLANNGKATVMRFENGSWMNTGSAGFSADSAWYTSLAIKNNGVPFVVYKDKGYNGRATVKKFSNYSWRTVGLPGFSAGEVAYTSIAINNNSIPYVVYRDEGHGGKATVKKFSDGNWKNVGLPGFTPAAVTNTSIRMECGTVPWIVYRDQLSGNVELRKFQQGNWVELPSPGRASSGVDMVINEWGTPYLFFREYAYPRPLTVKYLTGDSWTTAGPPVETAENYEILNPQILLNAGSDPYVLYIKSGPVPPESFVTLEIKLKYFNGSEWVDIWPAGQGGIHVSATSFAFKHTGQLLVAYHQNNDRGMFAKIAEAPYYNPESNALNRMSQAGPEPSTSGKEISMNVYPNPVATNAAVYISLKNASRVGLRLSALNGQLIWAKEVSLPHGLSVLDLPVSQLNGGVYLLTAKTTDGRITNVRIIK
jgi:hypothetical protein